MTKTEAVNAIIAGFESYEDTHITRDSLKTIVQDAVTSAYNTGFDAGHDEDDVIFESELVLDSEDDGDDDYPDPDEDDFDDEDPDDNVRNA